MLGVLARYIREKRAQLGLTQQELADRAGVTRPWLGHVESGKRRQPERELLEMLAGALGEGPDTLLQLAGYRVTPAATGRSLQSALREIQELAAQQPIMVRVVRGQTVSAGGGAPIVEELAYYPRTAAERNHEYAAYEVAGDCMEPRIMRGHWVIVDMSERGQPGDIVVVLHDGNAEVKVLERRDGELWLVALQHVKPKRVDETTSVVGVVKQVAYIP